MSLTDVLKFFFTALKIFLSLTLLLFSLGDLFDICCSVQFQIVVLAVPNVCPVVDWFSFFSQLQNGCLFSYRQLSDIHIGLVSLTRNTHFIGINKVKCRQVNINVRTVKVKGNTWYVCVAAIYLMAEFRHWYQSLRSSWLLDISRSFALGKVSWRKIWEEKSNDVWWRCEFLISSCLFPYFQVWSFFF